MHKSIIEEYLSDHEFFTNKYNGKVIVLIQVGSFFECYSTKSRGPDLQQISQLINIVCTKRDKSEPIVSEKNPFMMGFPLVSSQKFINILIKNNYTVVLKEQTTLPPDPKRSITNIYSAGTYIDNTDIQPSSNNLIVVYLVNEKQRNNNYMLCSGLSCIDLTTGKSIIHEALSSSWDCNYALDETLRFINSLNPSEIILYTDIPINQDKNTNYIQYLELDKWNYTKYNGFDVIYNSINYQNTLFKKVFKTSSILTPIEDICLDTMNYARSCYVALLNYVNACNELLLANIHKPSFYTNSNSLILGNNAIYQLNVVAYKNNIFGDKCLFDIINKTSTAMGHRLLYDRLVSPLISKDRLNAIYNQTEILIKDNKYIQLEEFLNGIYDIERLHRKLINNKLNPYELAHIYTSITNTLQLFNKAKTILSYVVDGIDELNKSLTSFVQYIDKTYIFNNLKNSTFNNIIDTFFNKNVHKDIDELKTNQLNGQNMYNELAVVLEMYIPETTRKKTQTPTKKITVKDGYLALSKTRAQILTTNIENVHDIILPNYTIKKNDLMIEINKSSAKIYLNTQTSSTDEQNNISILTLKYYKESISHIVSNYSHYIEQVIAHVAHIDFIKSSAKMAVMHNYSKPLITDACNSFINCTQLRHPIIEKLIDYEYVPHDINIGTDVKGILLYGLNSSGKSSVMKAIGLSLIMAQSGLYVPAQKYIFKPFEHLFTRISGDDNLFKGLSSFTVEMMELKAIMNRANANTLIIGDEICRGTEHVSGNAIVAATIIRLSNANASFIFATHLHEIAQMERIKQLKSVKSFHISVKILKDNIVYDRQLKEGSGVPIYGVIVARHIIQDREFIDLANMIKNELLDCHDDIIPKIKSRYNTKIIIDECKLCGEKNKRMSNNLETHHINYQQNCDINGFVIDKQHLHKNNASNLIILCNKCHDKLHNGLLSITGHIFTSSGKSIKP